MSIVFLLLFLRSQIPITISWHRENGHLPADRSYQERGTGTLVLNHVQYDDSGIYVCQARNGSEVAEKKLTLTISCEYCAADAFECIVPQTEFVLKCFSFQSIHKGI